MTALDEIIARGRCRSSRQRVLGDPFAVKDVDAAIHETGRILSLANFAEDELTRFRVSVYHSPACSATRQTSPLLVPPFRPFRAFPLRSHAALTSCVNPLLPHIESASCPS
jgi:hypothetical protein